MIACSFYENICVNLVRIFAQSTEFLMNSFYKFRTIKNFVWITQQPATRLFDQYLACEAVRERRIKRMYILPPRTRLVSGGGFCGMLMEEYRVHDTFIRIFS